MARAKEAQEAAAVARSEVATAKVASDVAVIRSTVVAEQQAQAAKQAQDTATSAVAVAKSAKQAALAAALNAKEVATQGDVTKTNVATADAASLQKVADDKDAEASTALSELIRCKSGTVGWPRRVGDEQL